LISITFAGFNYKHPKSWVIDRPYGAGAYDIVLFKTKTVIETDDNIIIAKPNTIILFDPSYKQKYYSDEDYLINHFVHFKLDDETKETLLGDFPFNKPFAIEQVDCISNLLWLIAYEYNNSYSSRSSNMVHLLTVLIKKIKEELTQSKSRTNYGDLGPIISIKTVIMESPQKNWTIKELARRCKMSESHFQAMYKKIYDTSCVSDLINARLTMAKELLRNSTSSVQEIAMCCGYKNIEHFSRQFKQKYEMSPLKYRSLKRNKMTEQ